MTGLLERFQQNRPALIASLSRQTMLAGHTNIIESLAERGELLLYPTGSELIKQGAWDTDLFFILAGRFSVIINGQRIRARNSEECVGELAGLRGSRARTATLMAEQESLVLKVPQALLAELTEGDAAFWRSATDLVASKLDERNSQIGAANVHPKVFVISSKEGLDVAREVRRELDSETLHVHLWNKGTFGISEYAISELEDAIEAADFTISIVRPDDELISRGTTSGAARDNVHVEYGISIGKLGRVRSVLLVDAAPSLHLSSDTAGLTTLRYRATTRDEQSRSIAVACDEMRQHIETHGVRQNRHSK